jgi:hypothetical protein
MYDDAFIIFFFFSYVTSFRWSEVQIRECHCCEQSRCYARSRRHELLRAGECADASREGALLGADEMCFCEPTRRCTRSRRDILLRAGQMRCWARTWAALLGLVRWVRI